MKEETNAEYLSVLAALGATIAKHKNDLLFAKYDVERLQKKLDDAEKEIKTMREEKADAKQCIDNGLPSKRSKFESFPD